MGSRTRAGVGAAAVVGLVSVLLVTPASAASGPGAPGLGDPVYKGAGNGGYQVEHYDIRLSYQPATDELVGRTTIRAVTTQDLSQFNLDFALKVNSVQVGGQAAQFRVDSADPSELVVTPARTVPKNQPLDVVVDYRDVPGNVKVDNVQVWTRTANGGMSIGQPRSAETWFPANDHPSDKATYSVSAAVPDGYQALSNGILDSTTVESPGWTRWTWRNDKPMVSYLPFVVFGTFEYSERTWHGLPYYTAYDPNLGSNLPVAKAALEQTPRITDFLVGKFGPYPFSSIGAIAVTKLTFAIENQTRPVYGEWFWDPVNQQYPDQVVAHEQAHQWFGDSVSIASWPHMWLNEGFATYAEWLWSEEAGRASAAELADAAYAATRPAGWWEHVVYPTSRIFHEAVYQRGAMALHALRTEVGDTAFFQILQGWHLQHKDGNATTEQFVQRAERVAGRDLDALFTTWTADPTKPPVGPNGTAVDPASVSPEAEHQLAAMDEAHEHLHDSHR